MIEPSHRNKLYEKYWKLESTILLSIMIIINIHLTVLLLLVTSCYDGVLHPADDLSIGGLVGHI